MVRAGAEWWRRRVTRRAVDITDRITQRSTLVIAAHPDDETFGAGATIARCAAAGTPIAVVVVTDGRHSTRSSVLTPDQLATVREQEALAACDALGVASDDLLLLGFEDGTLAANFDRLVGELRKVLQDRRPEQVIVPCEHDDHPDHHAAYHALRRAVQAMRLDCQIVAYPIWAWEHGPWFLRIPLPARLGLLGWALRLVGRNRPASVSTAGHLRAKRAALRAHASQTTNLTGEPHWQHLSPAFCALFLGPAEIFIPVGGPVAARPARQVPSADSPCGRPGSAR
jgi:LmbE family N-acetylglucosaminyl deacetylase